jgi:EmrB/QacA subfamily drug resistance transporter
MTTAATPARLFSPRTAVAIAYVCSMFMSAMDNHIVNVMLPTLTRDFHTTLNAAQWTILGYVLSLAIFIPASGFLGDRFGSKRMFLLALTLFTVSSIACGLAQNLPELVVCRIVQGAGGGLLTPVATTMLFREYGPQERARMSRILVVPILIGPVLAQPIGGLLVEKLSWRWAFYLNVPIGIFALVVTMLYMVERAQAKSWRFDVLGFFLGGVGLSCFLYAISEGTSDGWTSPSIVATGLLGVVLLALFARLQLRKRQPMLRLSLLGDRIFRATNSVNVLNTAAFSGLLFLAPVFLQEAEGQSSLAAGLTSFCTALGVMVASQTVGRIYERVGPRRMATVGQFGLALALASFVLVGEGANLWVIRGILFVAGFCNSGTMIAVQASMFSGISQQDTSSGSAILNTGRQVATAIGIALFTTVISTIGGSRLHAFHGAFLCAAGFALLAGVAAAVLIRDSDAAASMAAARSRRGRRGTSIEDAEPLPVAVSVAEALATE